MLLFLLQLLLGTAATVTLQTNGSSDGVASVPVNSALTFTCTVPASTSSTSYFITKPGKSELIVLQIAPSSGDTCLEHPSYKIPDYISCSCMVAPVYRCTLRKITSSMNGDTWTCSPGGEVGRSNPVQLHVQVGITSVVITSPIVDPVSVIVNTTSTFLCQTSPGNPISTVAWYKDNTTHATANDTQITSGTNTSSKPEGNLFVTYGTLNLQVQRGDQDVGVYCRARNRDQWFTSGTKKINVLYGPDRPECTSNNVNISPTLRVVVGSTFSISCTADSNPLPNIYQLSGQGGNNQQLSFIDIARSQAGLYIIEARNNMSASGSSSPVTGRNSTSFTIDVLYGAANLQLLLNDVSNASVEIEEHSTNNLQCSLESNPASHMFIVKDGKTILERPGVHQLIHGMTAECSDTGVYTCSGYNQYGTGGNASVHLFVRCSARKPTGVVVKLFYTARQHENVTLWYTIAAYPVPKPSQFVWQGCRNASEGSCSNSLDEMLKYNVKSEGLSSFLTIRDINIEDFGMYQLSVSNGIGSPFIEWLHLIPIGKPDSPSDFHVIQEEIKETSAVLTWVPGVDNGLPQTFYITYTKKGDLSGWITKSIQHTHKAPMNYTLRSLEPETEYIASIYASNENGFSPTINDTFITLKHIPDISGEQEDSHAGLIGGSVGGIAAVLVIIAVVFTVKKFRTSAEPAGQSESGKDNHGCKAAQTYEQMITATDTSVYDVLKNGDNRSGTDSLGCNAAQPYEKLSKKIDTSDYDALKKGNNGSGTDTPRYNAAQAYEELSMKTETSVYDAIKKGDNG